MQFSEFVRSHKILTRIIIFMVIFGLVGSYFYFPDFWLFKLFGSKPKTAFAKELPVASAASATNQSTTSVTYYNSDTTIPSGSLSSGTYLVMWGAQIGTNNAAASSSVRLVRGTTEIAELQSENQLATTGAEGIGAHGFWLGALSGSEALAIQFRAENTYTAYVTGKHITAVRLDQDLTASTSYWSTGPNENSANEVTNMVTTGTTTIKTLTTTFSSTQTKDYIILASMEITPNNTTNDCKASLTVDGTEYAYGIKEGEQTTDWFSYSVARRFSIGTGSKTITLNGRSLASATCDARRARIIVIDATLFDQVVYATNATQNSISSATPATQVSQSYTPNQTETVLLIGTAMLNPRNATDAIDLDLYNATNTVQYMARSGQVGNNAATDYWPGMVAATSTATTTNTFALRYWRQDGSGTHYLRDATLLIWSMTLANAATPAFSGNVSESSDPADTGSTVTFTGTAGDAEGDSWYLAVCKTNSVTAASPPTCAADQTICVSSTAVASSSQNTCDWTASSTAGSQSWYAFACDNVSGSEKCSSANTTNSPIMVKGVLALANQTAGQLANQFGTDSSTTTELFGFKLTPTAENASSTLILDLSSVSGIASGDITSGAIYVDADNNGRISGSESTTAFGCGSPSIAAGSGTITCNATTSISAVTNYIYKASVSNLTAGDAITLGLSAANIVAFGANSATYSSRLTISGSASNATHSSVALTVNDHTLAQVDNQWSAGSSLTAVHYRYRMDPGDASISVGTTTFSLGSVSGLTATDITSVKLYPDPNNNGTILLPGATTTYWQHDGIFYINGYSASYVRDIVVDSKNNIYIAGGYKIGSYLGWRVVKLDPDGATSTAWQNNGVYSFYAGADSGEAFELAVDSNDNLYIGGDYYKSSWDLYWRIVKLDSTGATSTSWKNNGEMSLLSNAGSYFPLSALAVDTQDNLYVGGSVEDGGYDCWLAVKYDSSGATSTTWQNNGKLKWCNAGGPGADIDAIAIDTNNNVYIGGGYGSYSRVIKLDSTGATTTSWQNNGVLTCYGSYAWALVTDNSNNLYIGGSYLVQNWRVVKLDSTGATSTSWQNNGVLSYGSNSGSVRSLAIDHENNLYVGGHIDVAADYKIRVAKYSQSGATSTDWNNGGVYYYKANDGIQRGLALDTNNNLYFGSWLWSIGGLNYGWVIRLAGGPLISYGSVAIDGSSGSITLATSTTYGLNSASNYLLELTVNNLGNGDYMSINFDSADSSVSGSSSVLPVVANTTPATHAVAQYIIEDGFYTEGSVKFDL